MTRVKGTSVASTVNYLSTTFGEPAFRSLVAGLPKDERALVEDGILVSTWYPFSLLINLTRLASERFGPHLARDLGRASADFSLTTVYKIFLRAGSPQFAISRASAVFKNYYETGEMRALVSERGHAAVELVGFAEPSPWLCARLVGWMERLIELSGGSLCRVTHDVCLARGEDACRFEGWWS